ncbi:MAG: hypothetical protein PHG97_02045 [Candidatus Margulisbacteria bacterium]|nr:hypothetical protein [Candidatus Margulisiibacteriota bacterium]
MKPTVAAKSGAVAKAASAIKENMVLNTISTDDIPTPESVDKAGRNAAVKDCLGKGGMVKVSPDNSTACLTPNSTKPNANADQPDQPIPDRVYESIDNCTGTGGKYYVGDPQGDGGYCQFEKKGSINIILD